MLIAAPTEPPSPPAAESGSEPAVPVRPLSEAVSVPPDDACLGSGLVEPVATWLGRDEVRADLSVEVHADPRTVGFVLRRSDEVRVERTLTPAPVDCADRRAALGLAIAMALDAAVLEALGPLVPEPDPVVETPAEPSPAEPVVTDDEVPPEPSPPEPEPEPPSSPRLGLALSIEGTALWGVLPRAGFGGELGVELGVESWLDIRVLAGGAGGLPARLADGEVGTWIGHGALEVCPGRSLGERVRLALCVGAGAGAVTASGRGFEQTLTITQPWVVGRTGGQLDVRLGSRVALRASGRLWTPVVDSRLDVRDPAGAVVAVAEPARAGGQASLGVVVRLLGPWR